MSAHLYAAISRQIDLIIEADSVMAGDPADVVAYMALRIAAIRLRYLIGPEKAAEKCYALADELATLAIFPGEKT